MPTKTAAKEVHPETAVEEVEEGTTPTPPADEATETSAEDAPAPKSKAKPKPARKVPDVEVQEEIQRKLYPEDLDLWVGKMKGEGDKQPAEMVFVFPEMSTITPSRAFLRRIYNLEPLFQYFEWMNQAKIPQYIQDLTDTLTDDQFNDLFTAWFTNSENIGETGEDEELDPPK